MTVVIDPQRLERAYRTAREALLNARHPAGHWEGELSTSALSTATACLALELVRRASPRAGDRLPALVSAGLDWLVRHQNADGGWGDTTRSVSNISTTMLCHATLRAAGTEVETCRTAAEAAQPYLDRAGGIAALRARYGRDRTFSIPILTHGALAGLVDWREVTPLPFELACVPANFYKWIRLPVVSYALPALIAVGQVRHHALRPRNPLVRLLRDVARAPSLKVLERIQPTSGGFLEATPLTAFVTMSLAGMGRADHPVARRGVEFLCRSVRPDGSWPIDTNLATWVTTLSINALGRDLPADARPPLCDWLLGQQYRTVHPYTNADPGGWAWTDLSGGVPDADDTPGAILACLELESGASDLRETLRNGCGWLADLQNADGGWPTFCRGWGHLPFDRSAPDLTAHAIRALGRAARRETASGISPGWVNPRIERGFRFLTKAQRADGSWLPLWFGNQHAPDDENPTYGTARVLAAYRDLGRLDEPAAQRGMQWLQRAQNPDGGWGGAVGIASSVEESALALEMLLATPVPGQKPSLAACRGIEWLLSQIDRGTWTEPSPIGFYFAKLWYFERLYPMIFTVAALRKAVEVVGPEQVPESFV